MRRNRLAPCFCLKQGLWRRPKKTVLGVRNLSKTSARQAFRTKVIENYQSAWSGDIYSLRSADEMLKSAADVGIRSWAKTNIWTTFISVSCE